MGMRSPIFQPSFCASDRPMMAPVRVRRIACQRFGLDVQSLVDPGQLIDVDAQHHLDIARTLIGADQGGQGRDVRHPGDRGDTAQM